MSARVWMIVGLGCVAGCGAPTLVGVWETQEPSQGVLTRLTFGADGWLLNEERDAETLALGDTVRLRYRVEGERLRQQTADGAQDSATDLALDSLDGDDRLTLIAYRPLGDHQGVVGRWRFAREAWAPPGTADRTRLWDLVFGATGNVGLSERYRDTPTRVQLGSWSPGDAPGSTLVDVDGEQPVREQYLRLGEALTPSLAVFHRVARAR